MSKVVAPLNGAAVAAKFRDLRHRAGASAPNAFPRPIKFTFARRAVALRRSLSTQRSTSRTMAAARRYPGRASEDHKAAASPLVSVRSDDTFYQGRTDQAHLAEQSGVRAKAVKAVLLPWKLHRARRGQQERAGEFTLPGLLGHRACRRCPPSPSARASTRSRKKSRYERPSPPRCGSKSARSK